MEHSAIRDARPRIPALTRLYPGYETASGLDAAVAFWGVGYQLLAVGG
jgi:hypothetical protein